MLVRSITIAVVKGAVVEFTVPTMLEYVLGVEFVPEAEDTVRAGFRGVEIVLRAFEGGELFDGKVLRKLFDREAGKIVRHSIGSWGVIPGVFIQDRGEAD